MFAPSAPDVLEERRKDAVLSSYVQQAGNELTFTKDAVQQHAQSSIPYRDYTPRRVFCLPEILKTQSTTRQVRPTNTWAGSRNTYAQGSKVLRDNVARNKRATTTCRKGPSATKKAPSAAEQAEALRYDKQLLSGSHPVFRRSSKYWGSGTGTIVLDNSLEYRTNVLSTVPKDANSWSTASGQQPSEERKRRMRAHRRWTSLPTALELEAHDRFKSPTETANSTNSQSDLRGHEVCVSPKRLHYSLESDRQQRKEVLPIVRQWCRLWNIQLPRTPCSDLTVSGILRQLHSPSQEHQLTAIALCAWPEHIAQQTSTNRVSEDDHARGSKPLPDKSLSQVSALLNQLPDAFHQCSLPAALIQPLLEKLQKEDKVVAIRMALALTFASLELPSVESLQVFMDVLDGSSTKDQWIAAQALVSVSDRPNHLMPAIAILLRKLIVTDEEQREHARRLLIATSEKTHLVNTLCGEQLNSQSGQERLAACRLLPHLKQHVNRDIANKLVYLLWHDSLADVRHEAGRALGSTGHGMLVHDELRSHLLHGNEQEKVDSLKKMGSIGLITGRLLPVFLECFDNEHMSVRQEAIVTAGVLKLTNDEVLEKLRNLITDSSDEVKRLALQALGLIGICHQRLLDHLPWAARFERQLEVRAQACQVAPILCAGHQPMIQVLNDLLVADESDEVRREARDALSHMGIDPEAEWKALELLRGELSQLSVKEKVIQEALDSHLYLPTNRTTLKRRKLK